MSKIYMDPTHDGRSTGGKWYIKENSFGFAWHTPQGDTCSLQLYSQEEINTQVKAGSLVEVNDENFLDLTSNKDIIKSFQEDLVIVLSDEEKVKGEIILGEQHSRQIYMWLCMQQYQYQEKRKKL